MIEGIVALMAHTIAKKNFVERKMIKALEQEDGIIVKPHWFYLEIFSGQFGIDLSRPQVKELRDYLTAWLEGA